MAQFTRNKPFAAKKQQTVLASQPMRREPDQEEIAKRAYELYVQRGGEHGRDQEDWLRAEAELRGER